jgi:hypothetical protein
MGFSVFEPCLSNKKKSTASNEQNMLPICFFTVKKCNFKVSTINFADGSFSTSRISQSAERRIASGFYQRQLRLAGTHPHSDQSKTKRQKELLS